MAIYSLPEELSQAPIKEIGFKVTKLIPIGEKFSLFAILKDRLLKPYFTNAELDDNAFSVLVQYELNPDFMKNSFYKNIETFLLNEGIIKKESENVYLSTIKAIEVKKAKSFEDFENPISKRFRSKQEWFNICVGIGAISGGIATCVGAWFTVLSYYDNRNATLNKSIHDSVYLYNLPVPDTTLIRLTTLDTTKKQQLH